MPCSQLQGLDSEHLDSKVLTALREIPRSAWLSGSTVGSCLGRAWVGNSHLVIHLALASFPQGTAFTLSSIFPTPYTTVSSQWVVLHVLGYQQCEALLCISIQGGPYLDSAFLQ